MAQEENVRSHTINHERSTSYRTEYVNGMAIAGPFDDGLIRLTFHRDAIPPIPEVVQIDPSNPGRALPVNSGTFQVPLYREDLITILITTKALAQIVDALKSAVTATMNSAKE